MTVSQATPDQKEKKEWDVATSPLARRRNVLLIFFFFFLESAGSRTSPSSWPHHEVPLNGLTKKKRAPLQTPLRQLQGALQQLPHRVLLRATPSKTCSTKIPWSAQAASTAVRMESIIRRGGLPPPPFPRGWCSGVLLRPCYKNPLHNNKNPE
jgi:hypothetical protein